MRAQSPKLVGIAGGSCAGKTWLAERLQQMFGEEATRLSLDDFYRDRSYLSPGRRPLVNFDHPRAIDWGRVEEVLERIARGTPVNVPKYDFRTHGRISREPLFSPKAVVIMDGLWLFRRASVRRLFDLKVYIRSSRSWCERQRMDRDTRERGRTSAQVKQQLARFTFPMFEKFVAPQEQYADVVLESPVSEDEILNLGSEIKKDPRGYVLGI